MSGAKSNSERIQKVLARAGLGSRREIESLISAGRIFVNAKPAQLGDRVGTNDRVKIDRREVPLILSTALPTKIIAYYKPMGEICTRKDPKGRKTVFNNLPRLKTGRWLAIGRLDINTSGLLLFTNNGELANRMMHPSSNLEREYAVRVLGQATTQQLNALLKGVKLDDGPARFSDIVDTGGKGKNHWYHVVVMEGRNREVRRLWESQGLTISRLIRVRFGNYILPRRKKRGECWELDKKTVAMLMQDAGLND